MNLNTPLWKEFTIGDYFDVYLSSGDLKIDDCEPGNIPLISSGSTNNGIVGYIDEKGDGKAQIFKANCITVDMFCNAFYQNEDFYAVSHGRVNVLCPKFKCNLQIGLFICSIIKKEQFKYSYGRAVYSSEIARMIIKLPSTPDNEPDWKYMEQYVKSLNYKPLSTSNKINKRHKPDVEKWKDFYISDSACHPGLFKIENCKCGSAGDLEDGDEINYIGAKKRDNGVMRRVMRVDDLVSKGNGIMFICDGEGSVGYANYMDQDFIGSTTTSIGYNPKLNKYNAMFIITIIDQEKYKFSYGRKYRAHIEETMVKLPVDSYGDPDWLYMENYIKSLPYGDRI